MTLIQLFWLALAVTVTTPNVLPVGVTRPVPAPIVAMSSRSTLHDAVVGLLVLFAKVATAFSVVVGGAAKLLTVSMLAAGVTTSFMICPAPESAPSRTTSDFPDSTVT